MFHRLLVAAAMSGILMSPQSVARADLIYNWSFPGLVFPGDTPGTATGQVSLPNTGCDAGCPATAISVLTSPPGFQTGDFTIPLPSMNFFHTTSGQIDAFDIFAFRFQSFGVGNGLQFNSLDLTLNGFLFSSPGPLLFSPATFLPSVSSPHRSSEQGSRDYLSSPPVLSLGGGGSG
jgi:hypothetical protein